MKKLLLLLTIFIISLQAGNCATTNSNFSSASRQNAIYNSMLQSNKQFRDSCMALSNNFKYDGRFAFYIKARCQLFEIDRHKLSQTIFQISTSDTKEYRENYTNLMAQFAKDLNSTETAQLKKITETYCKYNANKFRKKDPKACSPERINSLF